MGKRKKKGLAHDSRIEFENRAKKSAANAMSAPKINEKTTIAPFLPSPKVIEDCAKSNNTPLFLLSTKTAVHQMAWMDAGLSLLDQRLLRKSFFLVFLSQFSL